MKEWIITAARASKESCLRTIDQINRRVDGNVMTSQEIRDMKNCWQTIDEIMEVKHELHHKDNPGPYAQAAGMTAAAAKVM